MAVPLKSAVVVLISALTLSACQTGSVDTNKPKPISQSTNSYENIIVPLPDIPDSDGDGVLDELDQCPATPYNVVIDEKGCPLTGVGVGLKMEYRAFFAKDSSELLPKHQVELDKIAAKMNEYSAATFRIEANASEDEVNGTLNALTKNRALMVKNYLLLKHSIADNRLTTADCGAKAPIASSDTKDVVLNRRVYGLLTEPEDDKVSQDLSGSGSGTCVVFK